MKKLISSLLNRLDPYRQSFLFFHWKLHALLIILTGSIFLTIHWKGHLAHLLLDNIFVYLPNYLTHEIAGHNLIGTFLAFCVYDFSPALASWLHTLAGNGVETLIPLIACWLALRVQGGRWILSPLLYWLSTTFYGAGQYAQDARACSLPLTSSDMVTTYKPGEICGDWHHILEPIGLLNNDQVIAYTFLFIGALLCLLSLYSAYYYWTHPNFYESADTLKPTIPSPQEPLENFNPPNIYNPQQFQTAGDWDPNRREYTTNVQADRDSGAIRENPAVLNDPNRDVPGSWRNDEDAH